MTTSTVPGDAIRFGRRLRAGAWVASGQEGRARAACPGARRSAKHGPGALRAGARPCLAFLARALSCCAVPRRNLACLAAADADRADRSLGADQRPGSAPAAGEDGAAEEEFHWKRVAGAGVRGGAGRMDGDVDSSMRRRAPSPAPPACKRERSWPWRDLLEGGRQGKRPQTGSAFFLLSAFLALTERTVRCCPGRAAPSVQGAPHA